MRFPCGIATRASLQNWDSWNPEYNGSNPAIPVPRELNPSARFRGQDDYIETCRMVHGRQGFQRDLGLNLQESRQPRLAQIFPLGFQRDSKTPTNWSSDETVNYLDTKVVGMLVTEFSPKSIYALLMAATASKKCPPASK
ncbi:hypothetical protein B0H13DRAFT_1893924 [Mycena leptocephala]|nr:hypothetical protein B0H13DRAFT_1893924 [Mycena leptocephala]